MACHNYDGDMLTDEVAQVPPLCELSYIDDLDFFADA